ncbi:host-nuclease inhibitor Gam family protein [Thermodesulfovibrio sp.]|uniref:host-nuclease inhibitor Gam family protein n=1 Tax=Thermodesulfovibrio sp. TaxID=2067987 RepID=UPI0030964253
MKLATAQSKQAKINSWQEVDEKLRRLGEIEIAIERVQGEMTLRINEIKAEAESKVAHLKQEKKAIEEEITEFCEFHKEEFTKKRSRELTFGTVGYKVVTKIVIRAKKACVAAMEALGLTEYLRVIKEPDKEKMLALDDLTLAKVGATRKTEDKLRIEPAIEKIRELI